MTPSRLAREAQMRSALLFLVVGASALPTFELAVDSEVSEGMQKSEFVDLRNTFKPLDNCVCYYQSEHLEHMVMHGHLNDRRKMQDGINIKSTGFAPIDAIFDHEIFDPKPAKVTSTKTTTTTTVTETSDRLQSFADSLAGLWRRVSAIETKRSVAEIKLVKEICCDISTAKPPEPQPSPQPGNYQPVEDDKQDGSPVSKNGAVLPPIRPNRPPADCNTDATNLVDGECCTSGGQCLSTICDYNIWQCVANAEHACAGVRNTNPETGLAVGECCTGGSQCASQACNYATWECVASPADVLG